MNEDRFRLSSRNRHETHDMIVDFLWGKDDERFPIGNPKVLNFEPGFVRNLGAIECLSVVVQPFKVDDGLYT